MTVKEFVEDTLVQIIEGVEAVQKRIGKSGASITHTGMTLRFDHLEGRRYDPNTAEIEELVRFDIAVTAEGAPAPKEVSACSLDLLLLAPKASPPARIPK